MACTHLESDAQLVCSQHSADCERDSFTAAWQALLLLHTRLRCIHTAIIYLFDSRFKDPMQAVRVCHVSAGVQGRGSRHLQALAVKHEGKNEALQTLIRYGPPAGSTAHLKMRSDRGWQTTDATSWCLYTCASPPTAAIAAASAD